MKASSLKLSVSRASLLTSALLCASSAAFAADGTWAGTAAGNWSDPLNWSAGVVADDAGFTALFTSDITAATVVTLDTARTIGNLTFSDNGANGSAWTISGANTLTLAGGTTSTIETTTNATISSVIAGTNSLTKAGSQTLTLSGANTYSGGTILNGGTVAISNATAFGTGAITVSGNSAISVGTAFSNNIGIDSGVTLSLSGGFINVNGVISGAGNVTATNTIHLRGSNTYTGNTTVTNGFLCIDREASLGATPGAFNAASLTLSGGGYVSNYIAPAAISLNANRGITLASGNTGGFDVVGNTLTLSGALSGAGAITHSGSSTMTLSGANTWTGNLAITGGKVIVGGSGRLNSSAYAGTIALTTGTSLEHGSSTSQALTGVISGAGSLIKNGGSGVLTLSGTSNNTYTGGTTIGNGTISVGTGGTVAATSTVAALGTGAVAINSGGILRLWIKNDASFSIANNLSINGGTLRNEDGNHTMTGTVAVGAGGATFQAVYSGKNLLLTNTISGSGPVTVQGSGGQVRFLGANSYTGSTTVSNGTLVLSNANASSGFSIASGATLALRSITLGSTQNITGAGNLTKDISTFGASTIGGTNNTYTGTTVVNLDRFTLATGGVINGTSSITVLGQFGARFENLGSVTTPGAVTVNGSSSASDGRFDNGNGTAAASLTAASITLQSSFIASATNPAHGGEFNNRLGSTVALGSGAITVNGQGNSVAGGNAAAGSTFSTAGTVTAGSVTLNSSSTANTASNKGGTYSQTAGSTTLTGALTLALNGGTGAAGTAGNDAAFNLSGGSFTAGSIAVNAGTLNATGGTLNASSITVGSGAVFNAAGTAAITGTVTMANGSTLTGNGGTFNSSVVISGSHAPGASPGLQTFTNSLAYNATAVLGIELVGNTLGLRGTDYDALDVTGGTLSINPSATLSLTTTGIDYSAGVWDLDRSFILIAASGATYSGSLFTLDTTGAGRFAHPGRAPEGRSRHQARPLRHRPHRPQRRRQGDLRLRLRRHVPDRPRLEREQEKVA
jgi:autotransporter-associated beta strand protein